MAFPNTAAEEGPSFYLVPDNPAAQKVLGDPYNAHCVRLKDGRHALHLGFPDPTNNKITLGRTNCDITLPDAHGAGIQRLHCYFRFNPITGAVILYDKSPNHSTQVYDQDKDLTVPFSQAMNSVVVTRGFNRNLSIGSRKYYKFKLEWDGSDPVKSFLTKYPNHFGPERDISDPSKARYLHGEVLGYGGFGVVWKTVNIHDGKAMAVKRFLSLEGKGHVMAIREVNNMLKLSLNNSKRHDHILPILDVEYDKEGHRWIEIFMPLREGSVKNLIELKERAMTDAQIAEDVLYQMAKALKYMAKHKMVHRDIKPDNILYETRLMEDGTSSYYHFQLADFNLSNEAASARTRAGTQMFMAPEVYNRATQSCSTDIWSLFVTIIWIYNVDNFRAFYTDEPTQLLEKILYIASHELFSSINDMAQPDPRYRVSAKDLVARLEGAGTRGSKVFQDSGLESKLGNMRIGSSDDEEGPSEGNYVAYISDETAKKFAKTYSSSYAPTVASQGVRDGRSALADLSSVQDAALEAGPSTMPPQAYRHGRVGEDYEYQNPRNEEAFAEGGAAFEQARENAEEEDEEDEPRQGKKGKGYMSHYVYNG